MLYPDLRPAGINVAQQPGYVENGIETICMWAFLVESHELRGLVA